MIAALIALYVLGAAGSWCWLTWWVAGQDAKVRDSWRGMPETVALMWPVAWPFIFGCGVCGWLLDKMAGARATIITGMVAAREAKRCAERAQATECQVEHVDPVEDAERMAEEILEREERLH